MRGIVSYNGKKFDYQITELCCKVNFILVESKALIINNNKSVLIIDDEPDICFMLSSILKKKELASTSVHSIKDAGQFLRIKTPALVFLDNNLPDGRGIDFLGGIKKAYPDVKVIMITAYDTYADKTDAMKQGADEFLGKPFTRQHIYEAVDRLIH